MTASTTTLPFRLPFSRWWPLLAGALAGIVMRLAFHGKPGEAFAAMTGSFIYMSPFVVGAVTVYAAERYARCSWTYYMRASFLANVFYVGGTLLIMIEGIICALLIIPLFALMGVLGGLAMGLVCRLTNWPRQTLSCFALLPILMALAEEHVPLQDRVSVIEREVQIHAGQAQVWQTLLNTEQINGSNYAPSWLHRIGVPLPLSGTTQQTADGVVRRVTMGKQVYFDELIAEQDEPRSLRWTYRFYPDSFPPQALDEHVVVGGHYFDFEDTRYTLTPAAVGTLLRVRMQYRVSTRFNWYAEPLAALLIGDLAEANLDHYRQRGEAVAAGVRP
jgi:hypothetical protein